MGNRREPVTDRRTQAVLIWPHIGHSSDTHDSSAAEDAKLAALRIPVEILPARQYRRGQPRPAVYTDPELHHRKHPGARDDQPQGVRRL